MRLKLFLILKNKTFELKLRTCDDVLYFLWKHIFFINLLLLIFIINLVKKDASPYLFSSLRVKIFFI